MLFFILTMLSFLTSDKQLLASIINAECGICPKKEKYLVGSTVLNRVDDPDYPKTIKGVIFQKYQFGGVYSKHFHPTDVSLKIAENLLNDCGRNYDVIGFALVYKKSYDFYKKAKYHYFYE